MRMKVPLHKHLPVQAPNPQTMSKNNSSRNSVAMLAGAFKAAALLLAGCVSLAGAQTASAQTSKVFTDPAQTWAGYMNVFALPADGGGYQFGGPWGAVDLRAAFSGDLLTLRPCTNVSNPTDAYWVKADGSGNKQMEASWYVDTASLVHSNVTFSGNAVDYTLSSNYTCRAFIKVFPSDYSSVLQQVYAPITAGNSFFTVSLSATNAGAAHVQY